MIVELAALALLPLVQSVDSSTYANRATADLVASARERHEYRDRLVRDYSATLRTRIDAGLGRSRFARIPPIVAHETVARITWALPNDMKVDVQGGRGISAFDNAEVNATFERPWFVPRGLGDSIRLVDDELPGTAALHPLAPGAERLYRYAIVDSVTLSIPGRTVNAVGVRVQPKALGASLVAGDLWLDAATKEVVRFMFVFVGEYLWETPDGPTAEDSASARRGNVWANRIVTLEADLEYALYDARYWMPYRQLLQLTVEIPWFVNAAVPVRFLSTFDDYRVNTSATPRFEARPYGSEPADLEGQDSVAVSGEARRRRMERTRCPGEAAECNRAETGYFRVGVAQQGGRWEVHYPPADSLRDYPWLDDLRLGLEGDDEERVHETIAALGALQEQLPAEWVGRMPGGFAVESFSDIYRFNRVQGSSVGAGFQFRPGPRYTTVQLTGRFGLGDRRPTGSITWRRDAPGGRLDLAAYRAVREAEPWTRGLGFANSMNALFTGHDDADYVLALGSGVTFGSYGAGLLRDAEFGLFVERHEGMEAFGRSDVAAFFGDGVFQENAPVAPGDYVRASAARRTVVGRAEFRQGAEGVLRVGDGVAAGRAWASSRLPFAVFDRTGTLRLRAGYAAGEPLEQILFRVGGAETVRGFPYGARRGRGVWAAQLDFALRDRDSWSPVVFADVGDVFNEPAPMGSASASDGPLVGLGVGVSFLRGLVRFDLSRAAHPAGDVRFDLRLSAPR